MPIFMSIGSIRGGVADSGTADLDGSSHKDWIRIDSCSFEVEFKEHVRKATAAASPPKSAGGGAPPPPPPPPPGKSAATEPPKPQLGTFDIEKKPDESGPLLLKWMVDGELDGKRPTVKIEVCDDTVSDGAGFSVRDADGRPIDRSKVKYIWRCHTRYILKKTVLTDYKLSMSDAKKGTAKISLSITYDEISIERISYSKEQAERATTPPVVLRRE